MPDNNLFVFAIPLISKRRAKNWQRVLDNLQATLQSILNQNNQNFIALLVTNDQITLPEINHPQVISLMLPDNDIADHNESGFVVSRKDASYKRYALLHYARQTDAKYFMHMDADDLVSNKLVSIVSKTNHPVGCVLTNGYVMDYQTGKILPCPSPGIPVQGFDSYCGSSIIYNLNAKSSTNQNLANLIGFEGHHKSRSRAIAFNQPLLDIPEPLAIYVLNSEENLSINYGVENNFTKHVINEVDKEGTALNTAQILEFGLLFDNSPWL